MCENKRINLVITQHCKDYLNFVSCACRLITSKPLKTDNPRDSNGDAVFKKTQKNNKNIIFHIVCVAYLREKKTRQKYIFSGFSGCPVTNIAQLEPLIETADAPKKKRVCTCQERTKETCQTQKQLTPGCCPSAGHDPSFTYIRAFIWRTHQAQETAPCLCPFNRGQAHRESGHRDPRYPNTRSAGWSSSPPPHLGVNKVCNRRHVTAAE